MRARSPQPSTLIRYRSAGAKLGETPFTPSKAPAAGPGIKALNRGNCGGEEIRNSWRSRDDAVAHPLPLYGGFYWSFPAAAAQLMVVGLRAGGRLERPWPWRARSMGYPSCPNQDHQRPPATGFQSPVFTLLITLLGLACPFLFPFFSDNNEQVLISRSRK